MTEIIHAASVDLVVTRPDGSTLFEGVAGQQGSTLAFTPMQIWSGYASGTINGQPVRLAVQPASGARARPGSMLTATILPS